MDQVTTEPCVIRRARVAQLTAWFSPSKRLRTKRSGQRLAAGYFAILSKTTSLTFAR
jgi:hypothetical protein